jgi:hypothetical protein
MAHWTIEGRGARHAAGVDRNLSHGFKFKLARGREQCSVDVTAVRGARISMNVASARRAVAEYLDASEPPRMIRMDRDGAFRSVVDF